MELSADILKTVYRRVIAQAVYPGGVCPAEHVQVAYQSGFLPKAQAELVAEHLARCPLCREEQESLAAAEKWFAGHEGQILSGLAAKGAAAGIFPWSRCPSTGLIYRYANRQLPDTKGGLILKAEIQQHFNRCPQCLRLSNDFSAGTAGRRVSLREVTAQAGMAILEWFRSLGDALLAAAQATGSPALHRGAPGYRGEDVATLAAPVVGPEGQVLVDDQGKAQECRFDVIQAAIQNDGFLLVDLAAKDRPYFQTDRGQYSASLRLVGPDSLLEVGGSPIDEGGRVTFTGLLPNCQSVAVLPLSVLDVTVHQSGTDSPA